MIRLNVTTYNGLPVSQPLSAQFDELGGDIGRADTNQLVLPDPERTISRVHARVLFRASSGYGIVDQGSNAISVNGIQLGKGREAAIKPGDQIQIGGYVLVVEVGSAGGAAADPFADFFGMAPATALTQPGIRRDLKAADPLGLFGGANPPAPQAAPPLAAPPPPAQAMGGIPADWDPFAPVAAPKQAAAPQQSAGARALGLDLGAGAPAPLIPDLPGSAPRGGAAGDSLDALFGLGAPTPASNNPLAQSLLGEAVAQPNMAGHADPMQALGMLPAAAGQALPDTTSELNRPFIPPNAPSSSTTGQRPRPPAASMAALNALDPSGTLSGAVVSWNDSAGEGRTIIRAGKKAEAPAPVTIAPPIAAAAPLMPPPPPPAMAAPVAQAAPAAMPADQAALLAAFREGLGIPNLPAEGLTPEFMRLLGQLIHESARGTVDLLVARAALKREVRAEATMIVAKENNPLKFSPTAEVALGHLLGPTVRGFIPPQRAMRDAFDDLRAHQLAFLAGMRAALEGLLQRFDPAQLESRLTQKSVLSSLLPAARKAQLWSVFQQEYQQIAGELADDFHQVFGREFLRAYEAQLDALQQEQG
ncbi:FHA domain-containing protein [Pelomonas saccharophila]|uniref:FHA domain-containing protein n=1 Tax=Roseateles saccharophilus TaxID=304 RepID=A0ABU1YVW9_ROSSA|nr:type VI secretion system-associated FHA domain protein TagH [Roseateles saccharophilus]MDR7273012.1 FHA domain-containing protein [Roseateles saccharophilus]